MLILHKGAADRPRQLQKKAVSPLPSAQGDLICFCSCLDTDVFFSCGDSNRVFGNILSTLPPFLPRGPSTWLMISSVNGSCLAGTAQVESHALLWELLPCRPHAHLWELDRSGFLCSFLGGADEVLEKTAAASCLPGDSQVARGF